MVDMDDFRALVLRPGETLILIGGPTLTAANVDELVELFKEKCPGLEVVMVTGFDQAARFVPNQVEAGVDLAKLEAHHRAWNERTQAWADYPPVRIADHPLVASAEVTCDACPVQIQGQLTSGAWFYFRYRSGRAGLGIGATLGEAQESEAFASNQPERQIQYGDQLDGTLSEPERAELFSRLLAQWRGAP